MTYVAVSCGYSTCFAIRTCDGLCHLHLSIEAQCVTTLLPLGDCHNKDIPSYSPMDAFLSKIS